MKSMTPEPMDDMWGLVTYLLFKNGICFNQLALPACVRLTPLSCVALAPSSLLPFHSGHTILAARFFIYQTSLLSLDHICYCADNYFDLLYPERPAMVKIHRQSGSSPCALYPSTHPVPPLTNFLILCTGLFTQEIVEYKETVETEELCPEEV
jgi:hypothetical protein